MSSSLIQRRLIVYRSGDFAYGDINIHLEREGYVQYQSQKGPQIRGAFYRNEREGECIIDFADDSIFTGYYSRDQKNGFGEFSSDKECFQGYFMGGALDGYGRYFSKTNYYEGFWENGKMDGYGIEIMSNSDAYLGEYRKGKKEGLGFYLFAKGGYYYGFFKNNEKTEMGVLYNTNYNCYYIGEWKNDHRNGRGRQISEDGSIYNGFYLNDRRSDCGIMEYANGATYMGEWLNNARHGKGRMDKDGKVISGNFKYNEFTIACAVDLDEVLKPVYSQSLPRNMESYLNQKGYRACREMTVDSELHGVLVPGLLDILRDRAGYGEIKGHIFRKLRYLLKDRLNLSDMARQIYKSFTIAPNNEEILKIFKEVLPEPLEQGTVPVKWVCLNLNDKKQPELILPHMLVTNDCILGSGTEVHTGLQYSIDGVIGVHGTLHVFLKLGTETRTLNCIAGPNYLTGIDDKEIKFFLLPDLKLWKGFFIQDAPEDKKIIRYYMKIEENFIYGFGRDSVAVYIVSGKVSDPDIDDTDQRKITNFSLRYSSGYSVHFQGRLDEHDEIVKFA